MPETPYRYFFFLMSLLYHYHLSRHQLFLYKNHSLFLIKKYLTLKYLLSLKNSLRTHFSSLLFGSISSQRPHQKTTVPEIHHNPCLVPRAARAHPWQTTTGCCVVVVFSSKCGGTFFFLFHVHGKPPSATTTSKDSPHCSSLLSVIMRERDPVLVAPRKILVR